ncbi:carboxysome peptide B [Tepidimonas charontis]|uniref:Ethanolamine utilization protein EutN n=1 Tax=Tepidimonas charontis TaxID=2267262 RepID=A0A554XHU3_9BURK|nr:carboxysome peptide B [Tepidimonas charontis]TSE35400.1 Ethanolamine utilization protein EutN [Tepidimonas charontis]
MDIVRVMDELVCTRRVEGLRHHALRIVRSAQGVVSVATDAVGAPVGSWVFATTGSAARLAMPDHTAITDLTICGIIDHWGQEGPAPVGTTNPPGLAGGAKPADRT